MSLFRSSEDRKAKRAGVDESRIPPGQYYTDKWPVLHAGGVPRVDLGAWDFRAFGLVRNPIRLSFDDVVALGAREQTSDIHCVTRWTMLDMPWKGVPL
jgi:DMSO/TMAO reductase YedYZ molybdopterin-dependent catalytic subunit